MTSIEGDAGLDLVDGVVGRRQRATPVAALVRRRVLQVRPRGAQVVEGGMHLRLIGDGGSDHRPAGEGGDDDNAEGDEGLAHGKSPVTAFFVPRNSTTRFADSVA